jgi:hypothetical protein
MMVDWRRARMRKSLGKMRYGMEENGQSIELWRGRRMPW